MSAIGNWVRGRAICVAELSAMQVARYRNLRRSSGAIVWCNGGSTPMSERVRKCVFSDCRRASASFRPSWTTRSSSLRSRRRGQQSSRIRLRHLQGEERARGANLSRLEKRQCGFVRGGARRRGPSHGHKKFEYGIHIIDRKVARGLAPKMNGSEK